MTKNGTLRWLSGAGLLMTMIVACGPASPVDAWPGGDGVKPPGAKGGDVSSETCATVLAYAEAECARNVRCGGFGTTSGDSCARARAALVLQATQKEGVDERTAACTAELSAPGCGPTPTCAAMRRDGEKGAGSACSTTRDCKVGLACIDDVCSERHAVGGSCKYTSDDCQDGLSCRSTCQQVVDGTTDCRNDDACSTRRDAAPGYSLVGADELLTADFACDDATRKCRAVVRGLAQGQACGHGKVCADGLFCKRPLRGDGTCEVPTKIGERCTDGDGCPACIEGKCHDPLLGRCGG